MITLLLHLLRLFPFIVGSHRQLAIENLALRQQLAVYRKPIRRPKLRTTDRLFWAGLARVWTGWRQALVIVSPNTVLRWQRRRFREYWTRLSRRPGGGRLPISTEVAALVRAMAAANPLWGAPRIRGELLRLGIEISERTVSRLMPKRRPEPSHTWRTFLANHIGDLVAIDFFYRTYCSPPRPLRSRCARSLPPPRRPLQRHRASHRRLDGPAARRRLPGRVPASVSPPRP